MDARRKIGGTTTLKRTRERRQQRQGLAAKDTGFRLAADSGSSSSSSHDGRSGSRMSRLAEAKELRGPRCNIRAGCDDDEGTAAGSTPRRGYASARLDRSVVRAKSCRIVSYTLMNSGAQRARQRISGGSRRSAARPRLLWRRHGK